MNGAIQVGILQAAGEREIRQLSDVLIDCVEGGGRILLVAENLAGIVGTVQIIHAQVENQPHRAGKTLLLPGGGLGDTTFFYRRLA